MFRFRLLGHHIHLFKHFWIIVSLISVLPISASAEQQLNEVGPLYNIKHEQTEIVVGSADQKKRAVKLLVSYPTGKKSKGQTFPLIVFSHGHALDNESYKNLTDYWVARGYFVVAPLHLDSGGDLKAVSVISKKFGNDWIAASRLLDLNASIEQIDLIVESLSDFNGSVSIEKVIAAGHSYGALSSQQLAGAKLEENGDSIYPIPSSLSNSRVVAVVAISPPGLMKDHLTEATWQDFDTPQIVVTGPNDFFPRIWPNYEDHFISYLTAQEGNNYLLTLDKMDHYLGNLIGRLERTQAPQLTAMKNLQEASTVFIEHYLSQASTEKENIEPIGLKGDFSTIAKKEGVLTFEYR